MDRLCWCISLRECATRPGLGTYRFPTNHPTAVCSQPEITLRCTTLRTKYARPSSTFTFTLKLSLRRPGVPTCLCKHLAGLLATTLASHCTALGIVAGPRGDEAIARCGAIDAGRRVGPTSRTHAQHVELCDAREDAQVSGQGTLSRLATEHLEERQRVGRWRPLA